MLRIILIYVSSFLGLFAFSYYLLSLIIFYEKQKKPKIPEKKFPFVSIIIPAYNEEKTIARTVLSALEVDYPENKIELIVVDDGSKDKTYSIAKKIKNKKLKIFTKENGGKATALNLGIKKSKGEIIFTMDADTYVEKDALRKMVYYYLSNSKVMCVAPSMVVHNPKGVLQKLQQFEYLMGIYLRKVFATMGSIHVTPGAFSSYRKSFFDKHGLFEVGNITEDMEMALRIQFNRYLIECSDESIAYTNVPKNFGNLLDQRKRWYYGWFYNFIKYKRLFSKKYGQLGLFVLPVAVLSILFSIVLTIILFSVTLDKLRNEIDFLQGINFDFQNSFEVNKFVLERYIFLFFSNPVFLILILFLGILLVYFIFAKTRVKKYSTPFLGMMLFVLFYSSLMTFWWLVSAFYFFIIKKISWGKK